MMQNVDKQAVARAFSRAASHYQQHADLQCRSGEALLALARDTTPGTLLDAGCGPGNYSRLFSQRGWQVTALDLAPAMLQEAERQQSAACYVAGDIESLPFPSGYFDCCWSNLAVQWCNDLHAAISELLRVTVPGGQLLFSTLGSGSLTEMQQAWGALGESAPVNRFLTVAAMQSQLRGLDIRWQRQILTLHFHDVLAALQSLKGIGATHLHAASRRQPLNRQRLARLADVWPQDEQGYLLSYELIFGVAYGG